MTDKETRPRPERIRPERLIEEGRSASAVALSFLNDVKTGAGWTTGAVIVGGTAKKIKDTLSPDANESQEPPKKD
jgi:hypothetical protein